MIRDVQIVVVSQIGRAWDSRRTVSRSGSGKRMPLPLCIPATPTSGRNREVTPESSGLDPAPVVGTVAIPAVESVAAVKLSSPPLSGQLSPASPPTVAWENMGDSSVPLSPNRVQAGRSQDVPDEGSLFHVSPVSPGFLMHRRVPLSSIRRLGCCCRRRWTILVSRFMVTRSRMLNVNKYRGPMPL